MQVRSSTGAGGFSAPNGTGDCSKRGAVGTSTIKCRKGSNKSWKAFRTIERKSIFANWLARSAVWGRSVVGQIKITAIVQLKTMPTMTLESFTGPNPCDAPDWDLDARAILLTGNFLPASIHDLTNRTVEDCNHKTAAVAVSRQPVAIAVLSCGSFRTLAVTRRAGSSSDQSCLPGTQGSGWQVIQRRRARVALP